MGGLGRIRGVAVMFWGGGGGGGVRVDGNGDVKLL